MLQRFHRWYHYEMDMHAKVLASIETIGERGRADGLYQRCLDLFAHILLARRFWLHRLGVTEKPPASFFPSGQTSEALKVESAEIETIWHDYLMRLTEEDLDRTIEYTSTEGPRFRSTVEDTLTQLFGHSWYHRGQIAALVRAGGGTPAETDFVFWARESL